MATHVIYHDFKNSGQTLAPQFDPALLAIIEIIRDGLIRDSYVRLSKFGTFRLTWSKPGKGRNPKTGERITWPAQPRITFTAAKHLREWVEPDPAPIIPIEDNETEPLLTHTIKPENKQQHDNIPILQKIPDVVTPEKIAATHSKPQHKKKPIAKEYIPEKYQQKPQPILSPIVDDFYEENINQENNVGPATQTRKKALPLNNIILGAGMLALVPAIIMILQADIQDTVALDKTAAPATQDIRIAANPTQTQTGSVLSKQQPLIEKFEFEAEKEKTNNGTHNNTQNTLAVSIPITDTISYYLVPQIHTIEKMDNLWLLAEKYLGDAYLWPTIYRANLRTLKNPDKLTLGRQLIIPGLQNPLESLSENDRKLAAESYLLLYQYFNDKKSLNAHHFLIGAKKYDADWLQQQKSSISRQHRKYIS